jgi:hypothetical protein
VARNSEGYVPPQAAQVGRPRTYRLDDRVSKDYAGCTLSELAHDGMRKRLKPNARVPGGQTLLWFDSLRYQWRFPEHVGLFLALQELANSGCRTQGNSGEVLITARHARAAYEQYETILNLVPMMQFFSQWTTKSTRTCLSESGPPSKP